MQSPVSFGLAINNYVVVSASDINLCAARLGFPHLIPKSIGEDGLGESLVCTRPGRGRRTYPVLPGLEHRNGTGLYQPIFKEVPKRHRTLWTNDYVLRNSLDFEAGLGWVFAQKNGLISRLPKAASRQWIPPKTWEMDATLTEVRRQIYDLQVQALVRQYQFLTTPDQKELNERNIKDLVRLNEVLLPI